MFLWNRRKSLMEWTYGIYKPELCTRRWNDCPYEVSIQFRLQMEEMQMRSNKSRLELATKLILSVLRWLTQSSLTEHFSEAYLFTFVPPAREKLFKYWRLSSLHHTGHLCPIGVAFLVDEFLAVVKNTAERIEWHSPEVTRSEEKITCSVSYSTFHSSFMVFFFKSK